jgi:hypothetical protein
MQKCERSSTPIQRVSPRWAVGSQIINILPRTLTLLGMTLTRRRKRTASGSKPLSLRPLFSGIREFFYIIRFTNKLIDTPH